MPPLPRVSPSGLRRILPQSRPPPRRTLTSAPRPGSGPLMERRADRALPALSSSPRWQRTLPLFAVLMAVSALAIFNYQKQSSPVVDGALYALRTDPRARALLGDEIYFAHRLPWIRGEINQLHGRVDISFWVKGTRATGKVRFRSERKTRMGQFETLEWSLQPEGGDTVSLLQPGGADPFQQEVPDTVAVAA